MPTIDFTSGYRDANTGSTLKALAQRRAELQAAMASRRQPEINSGWQAAGEVANTLSGAIREGRLANQEAAGRARFAELLKGGLAPDEAGEAYGLDAETTQKWMDRNWAQEDTRAQNEFDIKRDETKRGYDVEAALARVQADKDAAANLAKTQETAAVSDDERAAAENRIKAGETAAQAEQTAAMGDTAAQVQLAVKNDYLTPEEGKARLDAINAKAANAAMSPGLEEQNKKFAVEELDWSQQGAANIQTQVAQIRNGMKLLEQSKQNLVDKPGYKMGVLEQLPPWAQAIAGLSSTDTVKARDSIRAAVQSSLKAVLGTQFAAIEGEQLLDRAFSTSMSPDENIRRAKLVMDQIQQIAANKQAMVDYYNKNGKNLAGYTGPPLGTSNLTMLDFESGAGGADADAAAPADEAAPDLSGVSEEELKRAIAEGRQ